MTLLEFVQRVKLSGIDRDEVYYSQGHAADIIDRMPQAEFYNLMVEMDALVMPPLEGGETEGLL